MYINKMLLTIGSPIQVGLILLESAGLNWDCIPGVSSDLYTSSNKLIN